MSAKILSGIPEINIGFLSISSTALYTFHLTHLVASLSYVRVVILFLYRIRWSWLTLPTKRRVSKWIKSLTTELP